VDTRKGHIHFIDAALDTPEKVAKATGVPEEHLEPIPDNQIEVVANMNRKQRRAWAVQQRRARKAGP
jgi:hypothetical protein